MWFRRPKIVNDSPEMWLAHLKMCYAHQVAFSAIQKLLFAHPPTSTSFLKAKFISVHVEDDSIAHIFP
jgi:hypothetical protein